MKDQIKWTRIGDLEWSENLGEMNWKTATKRCKELGGRLPTRSELTDLFDNHYEECKELINKGTNPGDYFWSSTENYCNNNYAWHVNLYNGYANVNTKTSKLYVRCVYPVK